MNKDRATKEEFKKAVLIYGRSSWVFNQTILDTMYDLFIRTFYDNTITLLQLDNLYNDSLQLININSVISRGQPNE